MKNDKNWTLKTSVILDKTGKEMLEVITDKFLNDTGNVNDLLMLNALCELLSEKVKTRIAESKIKEFQKLK